MERPRFSLVVPNTRYREDYLWSVLPSRGLLSIAAVLRKAGYPVQVVDADLDNLSPDRTVERIAAFGADVVGLTVNTFQAAAAVTLAKRIKAHRRDLPIVVGGPHLMSCARPYLAENPEFDFACPAEGDEVIVDLAEAIAKKAPYDGVPGLIWREGDAIRATPERPLPKDLDALPFPAFDLAGDIGRYPGAFPVSSQPSMHVMASRGCSFRCTFCSEATFGRTVRFRSPKNIADEVEMLHRDFGVREVFFQDDTMNLHRKWFYSVCDEIAGRGLNRTMKFKGQFRVGKKLLDEELLRRAKEAGFWVIFYGVESGSQRVLDLMKKDTTLEEIRRAFALTRAAGLKTIGAFMVGNVGDTRETIAESVELCKEIRPDFFGFSVATPIPGTEFYNIAKANGWIESEDYREYSEFTAVSRNETLSRSEITTLRDWADREARKHLEPEGRRGEAAEATGTGTPAKPRIEPSALPAAASAVAEPATNGRGIQGALRKLPVLGPAARYAWWWATLPRRVRRLFAAVADPSARVNGHRHSIAEYARDLIAMPGRVNRMIDTVTPDPPVSNRVFQGPPPRPAAGAPAGPKPGEDWKSLDWGALPPEKVKELMDGRFAQGEAYPKETAWDEARHRELASRFLEVLGRGRTFAEMAILDLGCGQGGMASDVPEAREFIGVDISDVAVHDAWRRFGHKPNFRFQRMNIAKLEFPDARFDAVTARETLEHLPDPEACVREAWRVLKPGGVFVLSSPNRDSLHLRVNRLLGHKDFTCSQDHVREFGHAEMIQLVERAGFRVRESAGVFCMPYWGIPVVDDPVRPLTDRDPRMLELLQELGRRVGPEYAFGYVIAAEKPRQVNS